MAVSLRVRALAEMLPACQTIADIGCDHGYAGLYLLQQHKCQRVLACDISEPSLQKARSLYAASGLQARVRTYCCDGLQCAQGAQAALIAGMGGQTICHIRRCELQCARQMQCLVLQPSTGAPALRAFLAEQGFAVLHERILYDMGRYYVAMAVRAGAPYALTPLQRELGVLLTDAPDETALNYVRWRLSVLDRALRTPAKGARGQQNQRAQQRTRAALAQWLHTWEGQV